MKETLYRDLLFVGIGDRPQTWEWIKSNDIRENEILLLKGKVENFLVYNTTFINIICSQIS